MRSHRLYSSQLSKEFPILKIRAKAAGISVESQLGAGGMGEVYQAKDTRLNRTVAIKVLASHLSSSSELKQRLEREARAISALNHPNICHLYDIGSDNGTDYRFHRDQVSNQR